MADLEQVLYSKLAGTSGITDLVSTRIYPLKFPENATFPCITFMRVATNAGHTMDGGGERRVSVVRIDCWDRGLSAYKNAKTLARAVTSALSNWREVVSGVDVQSFMQENEIDSWDSEAGVARVIQSWRTFHSETI